MFAEELRELRIQVGQLSQGKCFALQVILLKIPHSFSTPVT